MSSKVFLTGATGYIGGSVLHALISKHPEYDISVLLRNPGTDFQTSYPNVRIVKGGFDDAEVLSSAASEANVVVHCGDSDHEACVSALLAGLANRSTPSFYIHLGGTGIISDWKDGPAGELSHRVWSDIDDIDALWSRPNDAMHRNTEVIIQSYLEKHGDKLKTAVVCPPDLHGEGHGPGKRISILLSWLIESIQKQGVPFYVNSGTNTRSWAHIDDLMQIYLKLVEAAVAEGKGADWNRQGYYFASTEESCQKEFSRAVGSVLQKHGWLADADPKQLHIEKVEHLLGQSISPKIMRYIFTSNARTRPDRSRKVLGYQPSADSVWKTLEEDVLASMKALKKGRKI